MNGLEIKNDLPTFAKMEVGPDTETTGVCER